MATHLRKTYVQALVLVAGIVLLTGFAFGISGAGLTSESPAVTSHLDVNGVMYRFAPTTCTITDSDFLAAGSGTVDGEPFWISASADRVNLTLGEAIEVDRPADNELWMISIAEIAWEADDQTVAASAVMRDERDPNSRSYRGSLAIDCSAV